MDPLLIIQGYDEAEEILYRAKNNLAFKAAREKMEHVHDYVVAQSRKVFKAWDQEGRDEQVAA